MSTLFEEIVLGDMVVRNRLARSATWEGMALPSGEPSEKLAEYYRALARGGIGLIISGYTFVLPEGRQMPGQTGIHDDAFEPGFRALAQAVKSEGSRLCIQLVHTGGQTTSKAAGTVPLAPSSVEAEQYPEMPEELSAEGIVEIVEAFGRGAARARDWGADAVQLHGAHGYLISQFLSPLTNRRTDEYGGSVENRRRFLMEVYESVRAHAGEGFPVLIKLNGSDYLEGGMSAEDALSAARMLSEAGIDGIEVSGGTPASGSQTPARRKITRPEREAYHLDSAEKIRAEVECPVLCVGGFRSYDVAEAAVRDRGMDMISMSRPLIREPNLPERWRNGDRSPAACISCNGCFIPGIKEGGICCLAEKKEREKAEKKK